MDRPEALLQGLKHKLQSWLAFITKTSFATSVVILPGSSGEFSVVVTWDKPTKGEYTKVFDRATVFGRSMQLSPAAWTVQKCVGDFARDVVREVLAQRGV